MVTTEIPLQHTNGRRGEYTSARMLRRYRQQLLLDAVGYFNVIRQLGGGQIILVNGVQLVHHLLISSTPIPGNSTILLVEV